MVLGGGRFLIGEIFLYITGGMGNLRFRASPHHQKETTSLFVGSDPSCTGGSVKTDSKRFFFYRLRQRCLSTSHMQGYLAHAKTPNPPRTTLGPEALAYDRVLGGCAFS